MELNMKSNKTIFKRNKLIKACTLGIAALVTSFAVSAQTTINISYNGAPDADKNAGDDNDIGPGSRDRSKHQCN